MSERTSYTPGTPCWIDLSTPDVEAAERFYGPLFGWEIPELPNSAEMGGYRRAKKGGKQWLHGINRLLRILPKPIDITKQLLVAGLELAEHRSDIRIGERI